MPAKFPCKICNNPVVKNHKPVECDKCGYGFKHTNISKRKVVHGIAFLAQAKYFLFQT